MSVQVFLALGEGTVDQNLFLWWNLKVDISLDPSEKERNLEKEKKATSMVERARVRMSGRRRVC